MATKITLRQEKISKGRSTLYLDFYPAIINPKTGKATRREFLKQYVFDRPKTLDEKEHNKNSLLYSQRMKLTRESEHNDLETFTAQKNDRLKKEQTGKEDFLKYFIKLSNKRNGSNYDNWNSAYNYLIDFSQGNLQFADLNTDWCEDFKDYLLTAPSRKSSKSTLGQNSALSYFNKFKASLKQAYQDGKLSTDINAKVSSIKPGETHREYLSLEELQSLVPMECSIPVMKQAALFSALTGLRFSDINKMVWSEVQYSIAEGHYLQFHQQKTKGAEVLQINEQAFNLLGERKNQGDLVFTDLEYSDYNNKVLKDWVASAGITKKITFHCLRHTFATLQITLGTDIYTVSKMLGHKDIKTTQIYAKVINSTKRIAADKIKLEF